MDERRHALFGAIDASRTRLRALAFRMLRDWDAAEDAVQDACVRALVAIDRFRGDASLATWLHRITTNVCLDEIRRRRLEIVDPSSDNAQHRLVDDIAELIVTRADLAGALAALPAVQREALVVTGLWGLDYAAASALLGVSPGTIGSRVHRAKESVRARLEPAA
jgi:RNA polymerase sigma-70 factor (ECF subfamily)